MEWITLEASKLKPPFYFWINFAPFIIFLISYLILFDDILFSTVESGIVSGIQVFESLNSCLVWILIWCCNFSFL